jgi:hypothetical protein
MYLITCTRDLADGTQEVTTLKAKNLEQLNTLRRTLKVEQRSKAKYLGSSQTVTVQEI